MSPALLDRLVPRLVKGLKPARRPSVELRIPISATEKYLRMLQYLLESIQAFGGPLARAAHCVVSVSADEPRRDLARLCPWAHSAEFQWVDRGIFERLSYDGTGLHRLQVKSRADIVILADADLLVAGDLDEAIIESHHSQRFLGFIAHGSPFIRQELKHIPSHRWWHWIFEEAGLPRPHLNHVHTGWGHMSKDIRHRRCPDYFNYGFLVAPRKHVERIGTTLEADLDAVDRVVETWFKSQIATTLALARHRIPCGTLPIKYNFPLHVAAEPMRTLNPDPQGADADGDIKVFHYLGEGEINREHFATRESLEDLLRRDDLTAAASEFQRKLRIVHDRIQGGPTDTRVTQGQTGSDSRPTQ